MRKLLLQEHVTIDNFAADLNGGMNFHEQYSAKKDESFIKDNVFEEITRLKEQSVKDIVIWGSMLLAHSLMKEGLIDEVLLRVIPTTLGMGKPVFDSHMLWNS